MLRSGAALGGVAALAGCAVPGASAPASATSKQPVTLRWGLYNEPGVLNAAKKALPVFNERLPYITVG